MYVCWFLWKNLKCKLDSEMGKQNTRTATTLFSLIVVGKVWVGLHGFDFERFRFCAEKSEHYATQWGREWTLVWSKEDLIESFSLKGCLFLINNNNFHDIIVFLLLSFSARHKTHNVCIFHPSIHPSIHSFTFSLTVWGFPSVVGLTFRSIAKVAMWHPLCHCMPLQWMSRSLPRKHFVPLNGLISGILACK